MREAMGTSNQPEAVGTALATGAWPRDTVDKPKYAELLSGTFHEVADGMRVIDVRLVRVLFESERTHRQMKRIPSIIK